MEINIQSPHFTVNALLTKYVNEKVGKLAEFNDRIMSCEVYLKLDKSDTDLNKVCEVKVLAPGKDLFASSKAVTFEEAVNTTVHAIEKQIRKGKAKREGDNEVLEIEE
jgi:putative sigma-54 modulation protein